MEVALILIFLMFLVIVAIVVLVWEKTGNFLRRRKVARASLRELARMASDDDWKLRLEVAKCPNTPPALLEKMAKDCGYLVAEEVASRPDISYDTIILLCKGHQERALLRNAAIRADWLLALCRHEDSGLRAFAARHANLPTSGIEMLASDSDDTVRGLVAERHDLAEQVFSALAADVEESVRHAVAENPATPEHALHKLVDDPSWSVRIALALRPGVPEPLLLRLAQDEGWSIRLALAEREALSLEVMRLLARDEHDDVRAELARRSDVPASLLCELADDSSVEVRAALCENDHTPPETLILLANTTDEGVLDALASRSHAEAIRSRGSDVSTGVAAAGGSRLQWLLRYKKTLAVAAVLGAIVIAIETRDRSEENLPENAQSVLNFANRILAAQERVEKRLGCPFRKTAALLSADVARSEESAFCSNAGFAWEGPYIDGGQVAKDGNLQIKLAGALVTFAASGSQDPQSRRWKTSLVVDGMPAPLMREVGLACSTFYRKLLCISFPEDEARGRVNILTTD